MGAMAFQGKHRAHGALPQGPATGRPYNRRAPPEGPACPLPRSNPWSPS
jgi:hypothetical protein